MEAFPVYICKSSGRFVEDCDIVQCEYSHQEVEKQAVFLDDVLAALRSDECYYEVANAKQSAAKPIQEAADWLEKRLR